MEYPSGRTLSYNPDDLGRPTRVSPYITSIGYHRNGIPSSIVSCKWEDQPPRHRIPEDESQIWIPVGIF